MLLDDFWAPLKDSAPAVLRVTRGILAVSASTIDVESLFSSAGNVISTHRARLTPERAEQLLLLNSWLRNDASIRKRSSL
jgi:hypothetical protein